MELTAPKHLIIPHVSITRLDGLKGEAIFYKRSPKYIYDLTIDGSRYISRKWIAKVKNLKLIKSFSASPLMRVKKVRKRITPFLLNLLQHQRRTLKDIQGVGQSLSRYFSRISSYVLNAEDWKSWKNLFWLRDLGSLRISTDEALIPLCPISMNTKIFSKLIWRFAIHLKAIRKLRNVDLFVDDEMNKLICLIFEKFNYSEEILKGLNTLRIRMKVNKPLVVKSTEALFKNIFRYATEFDLQDTQSFSPDYIRGHFRNFNNLAVLKLSLPYTNSLPKPLFQCPSVDYLKHVGNLSKLTELKINLFWFSKKYSLDFFKILNFPASLQRFSLTIINPKWQDLINTGHTDNWEICNPFEEHSVLREFYQKWETLKNLESLNIRIENSDLYSIPNVAFITPILKRICNLKELYFEAIPDISPGKKKECLPFNYLWDTIKHFRSEIEILCMKEAAISLRNFKINKGEEFKLKRLELGKYVLGDKNTNSLIRLFKRKRTLEQEDQENMKQALSIDQLVVENEESFRKVLESFIQLDAQTKVTMTVDLRNTAKEVLTDELVEYIPRIRKNKTLDLTLVNAPKEISKDDLKKLKTVLIDHPAFFYLEIIRKGGQTVYLFDRNCHKKQGEDYMIDGDPREFDNWIAENEMSNTSSNDTDSEGENEFDMMQEAMDVGNQEIWDSEFDELDELEDSEDFDPRYDELQDIREKFNDS